MRLVTFVAPGQPSQPPRAGLLTQAGVVDLAEEFGASTVLMRDVLERFEELRPRLSAIARSPRTSSRTPTHLRAPLEPRRVLGTGLNYRPHVEELGVTPAAVPSANFSKLPGTVRGPDEEIELPPGGSVDYEGEVAVVIGAVADHVSAADAGNYIAGLCLANDVSARNLPTTHITLAKGVPGFCPLGPAIVGLDEVDVDEVSFSLFVNAELRQQGHTSEMIHSIPQIIASYSASLPLLPGDVILTGSPGGVGVADRPPRFLKHGDVVSIESPELGVLVNRFVATTSSP
jgi:2-keto-4-pentenoate hydratase/2-oxohepta-3-ene-1,7-dioic acid hydratase in catechol pathway